MKKIILTENQFNKVVLKEYLDKFYAMPLYRYFSKSDDEKEEELIYSHTFLFEQFLNMFGGENVEQILDDIYGEDETELAERILYGDLKQYRKDFVLFIYNYFDSTMYETAPAWTSLSNPRIIKNEWLIHFSDNALKIAENGFKHGTEELEKLAYTDAGNISNKPFEGYDFAYSIDDYANFYRRIGNKWSISTRYGNEAVIFRASGVKLYHEGDQEEQVIFWGPSAKDFIYVERDDTNEWNLYSVKTRKLIYHSDDMEDITRWIEENYDQYRKHLISNRGKKDYDKYYGGL